MKLRNVMMAVLLGLMASPLVAQPAEKADSVIESIRAEIRALGEEIEELQEKEKRKELTEKARAELRSLDEQMVELERRTKAYLREQDGSSKMREDARRLLKEAEKGLEKLSEKLSAKEPEKEE